MMKIQDLNSFDGIVVPPGCNHPMFQECGEEVCTYTPPSSQAHPHSMRGKVESLSVPKTPSTQAWKNMGDYLKQFQGANLCLDLWICGRKSKWCGFLLEVGNDFLVLGDQERKKISLIDLRPVQYIQIYCK